MLFKNYQTAQFYLQLASWLKFPLSPYFKCICIPGSIWVPGHMWVLTIIQTFQAIFNVEKVKRSTVDFQLLQLTSQYRICQKTHLILSGLMEKQSNLLHSESLKHEKHRQINPWQPKTRFTTVWYFVTHWLVRAKRRVGARCVGSRAEKRAGWCRAHARARSHVSRAVKRHVYWAPSNPLLTQCKYFPDTQCRVIREQESVVRVAGWSNCGERVGPWGRKPAIDWRSILIISTACISAAY